MNKKQTAFIFPWGVIVGIIANSGSSFAVDSATKKPSISIPFGYLKTHNKDHCDDQEYGVMESYGSGMIMVSPRMYMVRSLELKDEQRSKINKLTDELRHNNWAAQGLNMDETAKLRELH